MRLRPACVLVALAACSSSAGVTGTGTLRVDQDAVDLGFVFVGDGARRYVRVQNRGRSAGRPSVSAAPPFRGAAEEASELLPGEVALLSVEFSPEVPGSFEGKLDVSVAGVGTASVLLRGEGVARDVQVPAALHLGSVRPGERAEAWLSLHNGAPLDQRVSLRLAGAGAEVFAISDDVASIPARGSARVRVAFAPQRAEPYLSTLEVSPCAGCAPLTVRLEGTGVERVAAVRPAAIHLGFVPLGQSRTEIVRLTSLGALPIWLEEATLAAGPGSPLSGALPQLPLAVDRAGVELPVTFAPQRRGWFEAVLHLQVAGENHAIPIDGGGGPGPVDLVPATIDFGLWPLQVPGSRTVRVILHDPAVPASVESVYIEGDGAAEFTATPARERPFDLSRGDLEIEVGLLAGVVGRHEASLVVATSAGEQRVPVLAEVAPGTSCVLLLEPSLLDFGLVPAGRSRTRPVTIRNAAAGPCTVDSFSIDEGSFALPGDPGPVEIPAGGAVALAVSFSPREAGVTFEQATVGMRRESSQGPAFSSFSVRGVGTAADLRLLTDPAFPATALEERRVLPLILHNAGPAPVTLARQELSGPGLSLGRAAPSFVPRDAQVEVLLRLDGPGFDVVGELELWPEGAIAPFRIAIDAPAREGPCGSSCNEALVTCPASSTGSVGRELSIGALALSAEGPPVSCSPTLSTFPAGRVPVILLAGLCEAFLLPELEGEHEVTFDAAGARCSTAVDVGPAPGLLVRSTWEAAEALDLHVFGRGRG